MKWTLLSLLLGLFLATGCLLDSGSSSSSSTSADSSSEAETWAASGDQPSDQAEWDSIQWLTAQGPSGAGATQVMTLDGQITEDGRFVRFAWDRFPWSGNALGHFFVWDGSRWVGGKFEWITTGGQALKTLHNITGGYNGHRTPARGTPVAFAWTSADGRQRSNLIKDTWR